jgi:hypothetical protein
MIVGMNNVQRGKIVVVILLGLMALASMLPPVASTEIEEQNRRKVETKR